MRLCCLSADLDEIPNYHAVHGLPSPSGPVATVVYDSAVDRLVDFARAHDVALTLFVVASDLDRPASADVLRSATRRGIELGSHSLDHRYDLTRLPREEMRAQVAGSVDVIRRATGYDPVGFRAPGYVITDELFEILAECEVQYDSSVFPCPAYYAAKAAAMASIAARGRTSRSILDTPRVLLAPTRPYRVGRPYWRSGNGVLEIPIQTTRWLRLPFIGTAVTLAGPDRARWLTKAVVGEPVVNLELHGIDVLDAHDGLSDLAPHQVDVRVPVDKKLHALAAVVELLRERRYEFVTLREAASQLSAA